MFKKMAMALALTQTLAVAPAFAGDLVHKEGQIEFWHPDAWSEKHDENAVTFEDKEGHIYLDVEMVKAKDLHAALEELDSDLDKMVKHVKVTKHEEKKINGLDALWIDATGEAHDKPVHLYCDFLITPSHHVLMVVTIVDKDKWDANQKDVMKLYNSFKPHVEKH